MATGKKKGLTPRGKAMRRCTEKRGITEQPPGSNTDTRTDGIHAWQMRLGAWLVKLPWCGVSAADKAHAGGATTNYRWASVALIEDDAKAGKSGFRDWLPPTVASMRRVLRGDLVVWFGRGVHVGVVRAFKYVRGVGWVVIDEEGNTSPPAGSGSQANGGWQGRRERPLASAHGFARVDYPGGPAMPKRLARAASMVSKSIALSAHGVLVGPSDELLQPEEHVVPADDLLLDSLEVAMTRNQLRGTQAANLRAAMKQAGVEGAPF